VLYADFVDDVCILVPVPSFQKNHIEMIIRSCSIGLGNKFQYELILDTFSAGAEGGVSTPKKFPHPQ
jgi:hypothetical protein